MLARYFEYINRVDVPAFLWTERFGLFYHNALAERVVSSSVLRSSMIACIERAAHERIAQTCAVGSIGFVVLPLLESDGRVSTVLAVAGELANVPVILHAVHAESRHFSQIVHLLPHIVLTARPNGRFDYASRRWFEVTGTPRLVKDMHLAVLSGIYPLDAARFEREWRAGAQRLTAFSFEVRVTTFRGARWHELRAVPNFHDGHLRKWIVELVDIHDSIEMREALLRSRGRLNALADTGRVLVDVTSSSAFMEGIVQIAASTLGATCIAVYGEEDGEPPCTAVHPPEMRQIVSKIANCGVKPTEALVIPTQVHWENEDMRPVLIASLGIQGNPCNAFFAVGSPGAQPFEEDDAALIGEMAKRLGAALRGAAAYRRERRIAHVLQRAMLPVVLPRPSGIAFDVTYRASDDSAVVGGDWYDAFEVPDGKIAVLIGDVAGHGLDAAVIMGCVREGMRTTALDGASPGEVLMRVNRTVLAGRNVMVTAFVGLLDPLTLTLHYANAGHPPPLLVAKEGVSSLEFGDVVLGVDTQAEYRTRVTKLADVEALVLFTDGLIEFERNVVLGEKRLRGALQAWANSGFSGGAEHLANMTLGGCLPRDDVALLIVRFEQAARLDSMIASTHYEMSSARFGGDSPRRFPLVGAQV